MAKIVRDAEARIQLDYCEKFLNGYYQDKPPTGLPIKGFFREGPYLWTAFTFVKKKKKWELRKRINIQHEGYCRKYLEISDDEKI